VYIPTTLEEVKKRGWTGLDVIIVTGDAYIDSSFIGASVIGHVLMDRGYRVGIIAQPDISSEVDITRLGEPELFWGVTSGSVDSMISNYNADRSKRLHDDLTPGGRNNRRPDRALIGYTGLIRRFFKETRPIVLGGIEASLRRIAHYDYWDNRVRRSILFDSKADLLVYGMGERAIIELADIMKAGGDVHEVRGICYISKGEVDEYLKLPSFEEASIDKVLFEEMFNAFYMNSDALSGGGLTQGHGDRFLIHNRPALPLSTGELDHVYNLPYERELHPYYRSGGEVRALDTIRFSITTHRGCYGECNFCSIAVHQGRAVVSRSEESIMLEAEGFPFHPHFRGIINDVGGPTANMYGIDCKRMNESGCCMDRRCLFPAICKGLKLDHGRQINLLNKMRMINGVKRIFVASGIRYDMIVTDSRSGGKYLDNLVNHHISGQIRICLLYTSPSPRDVEESRMPSSA